MKPLTEQQAEYRDNNAYGVHSHVAFDAAMQSPEVTALRAEVLELDNSRKTWADKHFETLAKLFKSEDEVKNLRAEVLALQDKIEQMEIDHYEIYSEQGHIESLHLQYIDELRADNKAMRDALKRIADTDVSNIVPDFAWLHNWRNLTKTLARTVLANLKGPTE